MISPLQTGRATKLHHILLIIQLSIQLFRAGSGARTREYSLEDCQFTTSLYPHCLTISLYQIALTFSRKAEKSNPTPMTHID